MKAITEFDIKEWINKQMEINGYSERFEDLLLIDKWYHKFTTSPEKENEWREYLLEQLIRKGYPKKIANRTTSWIILHYGLKTIY